jgi:multiple sugar transport system permease protein
MKTVVPRAGLAVAPKARMTPRERKNQIEGLLFVSPWIVGFLAFTLFPLLFSLYISMTRYDLLRPPVFIGLANYSEIFFRDPTFWQVMGNTLFFVAFSVPLSLGF